MLIFICDKCARHVQYVVGRKEEGLLSEPGYELRLKRGSEKKGEY